MASTLPVDLHSRAKLAAESGNHDDAYEYYAKAVSENPDDAEAWLGKGIEAGWRCTPGNFTLPEMVDSVRKAIALTPELQRPQVAARAAASINSVARAYNKEVFKSLANFIRLDETWGEYVQQSTGILDALKFAHVLAPDDLNIVKTIVKVCVSNLQEIVYDDIFDRDENNFPKSKITQLPRLYRSQFKRDMDQFVAKRRLVEPGYKPPKIIRTVRIPAVVLLAGLVILCGATWITYCSWEHAVENGKVQFPGLSAYGASYVISGLEKTYGRLPCKITNVDRMPDDVYQVTGKVRTVEQQVVFFRRITPAF